MPQQQYQYAEYTFLGLVFGVIILPNTQVVTTTMSLAAAIGVEPHTLDQAYREHPEMFNPLRGSTGASNEIHRLLQEHRERFQIRRLKKDLILWTEEDIYMHCHFSRSERAAQFMQHNVRFLREWRAANVPLNVISEERFTQLEATCKELQTRLDNLVVRAPSTTSIKFAVN